MIKGLQIQLVNIPFDSFSLPGVVTLPAQAKSMVIFAHGSGSGRQSPRNIFVAEVLQRANLGTLLFDLLTNEEDENYEARFDIARLTNRLRLATAWIQKHPKFKALAIGYFGASTGAAAALNAAASFGEKIKAVVSRGGRPDMAENLKEVKSPTLLIVGGNDYEVIELNKKAYALINVEKELSIIPAASHLFEESGALEKVAILAKDWFKKYLR